MLAWGAIADLAKTQIGIGDKGGAQTVEEAGAMESWDVNSQRVRIAESISAIVLYLEGSADIQFQPSADVLSVSGLYFQNTDENPISIESTDGQAVLRQKGRRVHSRFTLAIPEGRNVAITVGAANFSGEIRAQSLEIKAGAMNLQGRLTIQNLLRLTCGSAQIGVEVFDCREIKMICGSAAGKMTVPSRTNLPWIPFWSGLEVVKRK
jgi:hypothetical protein